MKKILFILGLSALILQMQRCQSCSESGRKALLVKMAQEQGNRKSTKPEPTTIERDIEPKAQVISDVLTKNERQTIEEQLVSAKYPEVKGTLIQVEGLVLKEVNEITINLNTSSSQFEQIVAMRDHVKSRWHYVFDPVLDKDTWRSAEATIALKYRNKYSGDCDDFAILMASFARQIGLESKVIGGFNSNGEGHAFAVFLLPREYARAFEMAHMDSHEDGSGRKWISLDWFQGPEHYQFDELKVIIDE